MGGPMSSLEFDQMCEAVAARWERLTIFEGRIRVAPLVPAYWTADNVIDGVQRSVPLQRRSAKVQIGGALVLAGVFGALAITTTALVGLLGVMVLIGFGGPAVWQLHRALDLSPEDIDALRTGMRTVRQDLAELLRVAEELASQLHQRGDLAGVHDVRRDLERFCEANLGIDRLVLVTRGRLARGSVAHQDHTGFERCRVALDRIKSMET